MTDELNIEAIEVMKDHIEDMENVLRQMLQLTDSGGHDGTNPNCPTCHVANEARRVLGLEYYPQSEPKVKT